MGCGVSLEAEVSGGRAAFALAQSLYSVHGGRIEQNYDSRIELIKS